MVPGTGEVVLLGDVFCDIIVRGVRHLPEWGEEVFGEEPVMCPGGITNVAVGLVRLGVPAHLLARGGAQDTIGSVLVTELARYEGLRVTWLRSTPSTAITVAIPHRSERALISYAPAADGTPLAPHIPWQELGSATHLHLGGWNEGLDPLDDQEAILCQARARGLTTSLDVSWQREPGFAERVRPLIGCVDLFLPNRAEACQIAGTGDVEEALARLAEVVPTVVVKLGAGGAIAQVGQEHARVEGRPTQVVDTTGAGDAFAAGFLHGYVRRWPLRRSLELANVCGSLSVGRVGSSVSAPTRREAFGLLQTESG